LEYQKASVVRRRQPAGRRQQYRHRTRRAPPISASHRYEFLIEIKCRAACDTYDRNGRIIVGYAAAGPTDIAARPKSARRSSTRTRPINGVSDRPQKLA
jgi:hypothetical protein